MCVSHFVILSAYLLIVVWSVVHVVFSIHKIIHAWCFFSVCGVCLEPKLLFADICFSTMYRSASFVLQCGFFFLFLFWCTFVIQQIYTCEWWNGNYDDWMQTTECCRMMMRWSARTRNKPESSRYNNLYRLLMWNKSRMISSSLDVRTSDSLICIHFVFICV